MKSNIQVQEIKIINVIKDKAFLTVNGNETDKNTLDNLKPPFIGYGLEGYAVASLLSYWYGTNVAFIREQPKKYGTRNQIDGYMDESSSYTIVAPSEKVEEAVYVSDKHSLKLLKILTFSTIKQNLIIPDLDFGKNKIKENIKHYNLKKYLKNLQSSNGFLLSSGIETNTYVETLPAANMYEVIEMVIVKYSQLLSEYDVYVGMGFGGVYFAIVAAMMMNKKFVLLDMKGQKKKINYNGNMLFFDDFMSTGTNIEIANNLIDNEGIKAAIVLYSRKRDLTCMKLYVCDMI